MNEPVEGAVRLRLLVAYDGGPFRGWQSQAGGGAVQDFLEAAVGRLCLAAERVVVHGAGRTDAGVHARGQVAHADVPAAVFARFATGGRWPAAINAHLPPAIRVLRAGRAPAPGWHARFSATGKVYRYRLWNAPALHPFEIGRAWHLPGALDVARLTAAAGVFVGRHDFAGFAASRGRPEPDTVRTVHRVAARRGAGGLVTVEFAGDGFLYRMVRLLTGTLVRVGQGRMEETALRDLLERPAGRRSSFAAPAAGLTLVRVSYPPPAARRPAVCRT